jgi:hypothetical protein
MTDNWAKMSPDAKRAEYERLRRELVAWKRAAKEHKKQRLIYEDCYHTEWSRAEDLRAQRDELRAAVEAVEYVPIATHCGHDLCAWCGWHSDFGHAPDCQRQRALGLEERGNDGQD